MTVVLLTLRVRSKTPPQPHAEREEYISKCDVSRLRKKRLTLTRAWYKTTWSLPMSSRLTRRGVLGLAAGAAVAAPASRLFGFAAEPKPLQTTILEARAQFVPQSFLRPLIISSGKITEITEAQAEVRVRVEGREALGRGLDLLERPLVLARSEVHPRPTRRRAAPRSAPTSPIIWPACAAARRPIRWNWGCGSTRASAAKRRRRCWPGRCAPAPSTRRSTTRWALPWARSRRSISIATRCRFPRPIRISPAATPAPPSPG